MDISLSTTYTLTANGIRQQVTVTGEGEPVMLLHGWPLTSYMWRMVTPILVAAGYQTIAPDLRGIGGSERPTTGYDVENLAADAMALLKELDVQKTSVVGIDLGAPVAWMMAMRYPQNVRRVALMEGLIGRLPGAEDFLRGGPPWWFGFHGVPGLAETVLEGREAEYLEWFLASRTPGRPGVSAAARAFYVNEYRARDGLRGGFEHYRAMPESARQIEFIAASHRLTQPTLAISGGVVGDALTHQLRSHTDHLSTQVIEGCGHNIPEEQPEALAEKLCSFFSRSNT
ncbi:alpha/beta fold hydrolase [Burkholderia stagnalis]